MTLPVLTRKIGNKLASWRMTAQVKADMLYEALFLKQRPEHFVLQALRLHPVYDRTASPKEINVYLQTGKPLSYEVVVKGGLGKAQDELTRVMIAAINAVVLEHRVPAEEIARAERIIDASVGEFSCHFVSNTKRIMSSCCLLELSLYLESKHNAHLRAKYAGARRVRSRELFPLYWAYLYADDRERLTGLIDRAPLVTRLFMRKHVALFLSTLGYLPMEAAEGFRGRRLRGFGSVTRRYGEYLSGKNVAILGPAPYALDTDEVNASRDVNIRMNYYYAAQVPEGKRACPTNVVYLNSGLMAHMMKEHRAGAVDYGIFDSIDYVMCKVGGEEFFGDMRQHTVPRCCFPPSPLFTSCNILPNMAQLVLFDLLHFPIGSVKLYNANFYLSANRYEQTYHGVNPMTLLRFWFTLGLHHINPLFLVVKRMYENGRIEADDGCAEVLRLDVDTYVREMQAMEWKRMEQAERDA